MPPVPAKRYDIFISAFEKYVADRQKEIARVDRMMRPYEIVRIALERAKLPNDVRLELKDNGVSVNITIMEDDRRPMFDRILEDIGSNLKAASIHPDGCPVHISSGLTLHYYWRLRGLHDIDPPDIDIYLHVPSAGTRYINVVRREEIHSYTVRHYTVSWIDDEVTHVES